MVSLSTAAMAALLAGGKLHDPLPDSLISPDSLRRHVEFLASTPGPRSFDNPAALRAAYGYVEERFRSSGIPTELQEFSAAGRTYVNVIGRINPEKSRMLVLGAHYDVCGNQQGADDNASGVAGLIEIARLLKASEKDLDYQIQFVAYANEEPPFYATEHMGSHVHAASLKESGAGLELAVVLEMIGYFSDAEDSQRYPSILMKPFYPSKGDFIAAVSDFGSMGWVRRMKGAINRGSRIRCQALAAPRFVTGVDFSDHRSYWTFGFPAIMITNTSFYRTPHYHESTDVPATLDYVRMRQVALGVSAFFLRLDSGLKKPRKRSHK